MKKVVIISLIFSIIIGSSIIGASIILSNNKMKQLQYKTFQETIQEQGKQSELKRCIESAKESRTDLWNANCTKQSDGGCTIQNNTGTIDWIEDRYQSDLNNCYKLYD